MIYLLLTINSLLMIVMPIILGIWLARRYHTGWLIFLIGSAGFIGSQVLHIPFNQFALNPLLQGMFGGDTSVVAALTTGVLLGLSAGVFEEGTRYLIFRWRTGMRDWEEGLMMGAGWGGAEAIIFGVLAAIAIVNVYLYQSGMLESMVSAEQIATNPDLLTTTAAQMEELINQPPWYFLLGAIERFLAITLQLSLTILVLQAFVRKNVMWLVYAVLWHTAANTVAVFGTVRGWNPLMIEVALAFFAAASLVIILRLRPQPGAAVAPITPDDEPPAADSPL